MINFNLNFNTVKTTAPTAPSPYIEQDPNSKSSQPYTVIKTKTLPAGTPAGTIKIS
jgi:hypothetical protein